MVTRGGSQCNGPDTPGGLTRWPLGNPNAGHDDRFGQ